MTLRRLVNDTQRFKSTAMFLNAGNWGTVARRYIAKDQKPPEHRSEYLKTRKARFGVTDALYVL
jgi:hypothetical protein